MRLTLLILTAATLLPCESLAEEATDYFPFAKGHEWIYESRDAPPGSPTVRVHKRVEGPVEREGKSYWPVVTSGRTGDASSTAFYRLDATGVYTSKANEQPYLPFPIQPGKTNLGEWDDRTVSYEDVTIGEITYEHCLRVTTRRFHIIVTRWFAAGVGEIQWKSQGPFGGATYSLREFKPAK